MRVRQIEDQRDNWPVRVMCDALSVSPSGYYAWRSRPESPRKSANRVLLGDIQRVHARHRERYGAPRIHAELRAEGQTVGRKRIERMMRHHGIRACQWRSKFPQFGRSKFPHALRMRSTGYGLGRLMLRRASASARMLGHAEE